MRLIGTAERSLEIMIQRVKSRVAFGKALATQGTILADIANSRMEIEQARLLTFKAAYMMDKVGNKTARQEISMIKVTAPNMALRVIDRAIQSLGARGVSGDEVLASLWANARTLRIADGPDEVHRQTIANIELSTSGTKSSNIYFQKSSPGLGHSSSGSSLQQQFEQASGDTGTLSGLGNEDLLELYALYKQATAGDNNTIAPEGMKARTKWDAWSSLRGISKEDAMKKYLAKVKTIKSKAAL